VIAVLIVSCPCTIGLAVPMVIVVASGVAAEKGVIFKSSNAIELAHKTTHVGSDKTGNLTCGKLAIVLEEYPNLSPSTRGLLGLIAESKHLVSTTIVTYLRNNDIKSTLVSNTKNIVGRGVEGSFAGRKIRAGNFKWLGLSDSPIFNLFFRGYTYFVTW